MLTQSQGLSSSWCCPASKEAGDTQGAGRGYSQGSWSRLAKGMSHTIGHHGIGHKKGQVGQEVAAAQGMTGHQISVGDK